MSAQKTQRRARERRAAHPLPLSEALPTPLFPPSAQVLRRPLQRLFDALFALCALILTAPLLLLCALAVALTSQGPIFFASERVGRAGRLIRCYKLRTMQIDAERHLQQLLDADPKQAREYLLHHKLKKDPRITPIGRFLRRYSLDELPQLVNVLRGELSIVGPRPYLAHELLELAPQKRAKLLAIRPGLTGPWQTGGRSDLSFNERVDIESKYGEKSSFWSDLVYILKTLPAIIFAKGAR